MTKVVFYLITNGRALVIRDAVVAGCRRHGIDVVVRRDIEYREPEADVAVFYGLYGNLRRAQRDYPLAGRKSVLIDLGYWGRVEGGKVAGFHRISVNALHATGYFQRLKHGPERFNHFNLRRRPFSRAGSYILLCGMSAKAAWVYDLKPEEWERAAVAGIRKHTDREIRYRPKQSWKDARPIPGTTWAPDKDLIGPGQLDDCWAVVTHHGNTALDALIAGIPAFSVDGIARPLTRRFIEDIEQPFYPSEAERDQLLFDAAWTQWKVSEIADGSAWQYLKDEGLIP